MMIYEYIGARVDRALVNLITQLFLDKVKLPAPGINPHAAQLFQYEECFSINTSSISTYHYLVLEFSRD